MQNPQLSFITHAHSASLCSACTFIIIPFRIIIANVSFMCYNFIAMHAKHIFRLFQIPSIKVISRSETTPPLVPRALASVTSSACCCTKFTASSTTISRISFPSYRNIITVTFVVRVVIPRINTVVVFITNLCCRVRCRY